MKFYEKLMNDFWTRFIFFAIISILLGCFIGFIIRGG